MKQKKYSTVKLKSMKATLVVSEKENAGEELPERQSYSECLSDTERSIR